MRDLRLLNAGAACAGGIPFPHVELAHAHLDGRAGRELRACVSLDELRRLGAFFTGEHLAKRAVDYGGNPAICSKIVDPACGCGDLLIAAARRLPVHRDLVPTLAAWGEVLHGIDDVPEFVEVARERLMLLALLRGARPSGDEVTRLAELLPNIAVGNGRRHGYVRQADMILLNPPYGAVAAPADIAWTSGTVTESALWVAEIAAEMAHRARLVAVLPDVLRSGSRFERWRAEIAKTVRIDELRIIGQFDALTDIDVFVLAGVQLRDTAVPGWPRTSDAGPKLGDICSVMVGPVVDRRDAHRGPRVPYITTAELPQSGEILPSRTRRFAKRLFTPPFVVVRRTSRPSLGQSRVRPVIIRGSKPVAVENHLIVLAPTRRALRSCRELTDVLLAQPTTDWLNQRIRTRHLTVSALREVPVGARDS